MAQSKRKVKLTRPNIKARCPKCVQRKIEDNIADKIYAQFVLESPEQTIERLVAFTGECFDSKNSLWFAAGKFDQFVSWLGKCRRHNRIEKWVDPLESICISWKPLSEPEIHGYIKHIYLNSKSEKDTANFSEFQTDEVFILLLRLTHPIRSEMLGELLIINPNRELPLYHPNLITHYCNTLAKYFDICLQIEKVKKLSYLDDVTGLFNQRFLSWILDKEIKKNRRDETEFSLLFLDIDHFKKVNDLHGHLVGSTILRLLGSMIEKQIRAADYGFRYGGDEFIIILDRADLNIAKSVAERLRQQVEETQFRVEDHTIQITVSIGIAVFPIHAATKEELIKMADVAMYYAKGRNRNTVCVAS